MSDGMKIQLVPVDGLTRYARNARTHSPEQIGQIKASMLEFGWTNPILADMSAGGSIVAGHGRLSSAQELFKSGVAIKLPNGETLPAGMVPVIDCAGWTDAQRRAYVLVDNKTAINAGWDEEMLRLELAALEDDGFDLSLTGFDPGELDGFLGVDDLDPPEDTEPQTDRAEELRKIWGVEPGQIWTLGEHRLMCGDSTRADHVATLLGEDRPHLMVTDPPYGVEYDADWRNDALAGKPRADGKIGGGAKAVGKVMNDERAEWADAWALFPGEVAYVWCAPGPLSVAVYESLVASGFEIRMQIIWAKSQLVIGRGHYHCRHEPCWYAVRKGGTGHWQGSRKESTVWDIDKPNKSETGHSTQKPIECMAKPIENNSALGDLVYEPFSGSGTTIIAAENLGRKARAMELFPGYVAVTLQRWSDHTGLTPALAA